MHHAQSQVLSTDSALLSRSLIIKEPKDSNMIDPGGDEDIDIELLLKNISMLCTNSVIYLTTRAKF